MSKNNDDWKNFHRCPPPNEVPVLVTGDDFMGDWVITLMRKDYKQKPTNTKRFYKANDGNSPALNSSDPHRNLQSSSPPSRNKNSNLKISNDKYWRWVYVDGLFAGTTVDDKDVPDRWKHKI